MTLTDTNLDLRGEKCPMAFVKARLALDQMPDGQLVEIIADDSPANTPLAQSVREIGHTVLSVNRYDNDSFLSANLLPVPSDPRKDSLRLLVIKVQVKK